MTDKILIDLELLERLHSILSCGAADEDIIVDAADELRAALVAPQQEAVAWYCDAHGYTDNKDDAESWRDRGMPVTEYYLHPALSVPEGWQLVPKKPTLEMLDVTVFPQGVTHLYCAMLSAAPNPPTTDDRKDAERP